ncbi:GDSL esterase/lipase [Canna indica]|uniref:GDSL esterase/lipase n=1 Tax=Canna indica TaxID=4628 RepID=A0AAQ3JRW8_9LILI|nr:GDSL esterase/lipase [Canna indica]
MTCNPEAKPSSIQMAPSINTLFFFFFHLLLCLTPSLAVAAGRVPALIVFGDSTADPGNNNNIPTLFKSNFPPYGRDFPGGRPTGRFSNGRLASDFISEGLGLPLTVPAYLDPGYGIEDFAKGVSFASAGTGLDKITSDLSHVIPLWKEVEFFKEYQEKLRSYAGEAMAAHIVGEAVYIVSIGTNDFLVNYFSYVTGRAVEFTVDEFAGFLVSIAGDFLTEIYRLGARKITFFGLVPIGCLPLERTVNVIGGGGCNEKLNEAARSFNAKLQALIGQLNASLPRLKLSYTPVDGHVLDILNNPSAYGIENVEEGCCGTGKMELGYLCNPWSPFTCEDADKYAFWDAFHPTEKMYRLVAEATLRTLAEFI